MELTPMMKQYISVKKEHPDEILFFRLGDFYEMFFEDAKLVSKELGLTLTSRSGDTEKNPMCGVPYHAVDTYLNKLIKKGYKVAIAEQIGDPKTPGLTKREVTKIITPGTVLSESILVENQNNYISLIAEYDDLIVLVSADVSTGEMYYNTYLGKDKLQKLYDDLYRLMMPELLILKELSFEKELQVFLSQKMNSCLVSFMEKNSSFSFEYIQKHFPDDSFLLNKISVKKTIEFLLKYLHKTLKGDLSHLNQIKYLDSKEHLIIDSYTLRNLEITHNLRDNGKKNTLLDVIDFTQTAMGSRLLKKWLEYPLLDITLLNHRLDAVEELLSNFSMREKIYSSCKEIYDFERLVTRLEIGSTNARDLIALKNSFSQLPILKDSLEFANATSLKKINKNIILFPELFSLIERAIVNEPSLSLRDGGIIKDGYNEELDTYRKYANNSKKFLQEIEERERNNTGIKTLKLGFNKVFGYYLEARHSATTLIPPHYIRKQTLANAERYITDELKELETKILGAQEKIINLEYNLFLDIVSTIKKHLINIQKTAKEVAKIDVLYSLSEAAQNYNYVRPQLNINKTIEIKDGRHPIVERIIKNDLFVPNDVSLNHNNNEIMIITGPNMAGKSTYMRQVALLTLMAQIGSFIPAREANISPVDRIFTRIGASDDLTSGQSTFMVEMNEVSHILQHATQNSLIILDEIGRGTSTFDGISIARAVIEHIRDKIHAKTLFATHYHELTDLENNKIKNFSIAVKERGSDIVFLRRIVSGGADKSYGIHVAKLAGLPSSITQRANNILTELESQHQNIISDKNVIEKNTINSSTKTNMESLFTTALVNDIINIDVMSMTPIEALNKLYQLQNRAKIEAGLK